VNQVPVTSAPRTVLDLAELLTLHQVKKVLNELEVQGIVDELSIPDLLERYPRKRGSSKLRTLLAGEAAFRGVTREELEQRFAALLEATDLPRPRLNADVAVRGRFFEADCLWAEERVIVELDGRAAHGTRQAFEKDRERDRLLQADGWRVIRITWRQLRDDAPAVVADLRRILRPRTTPPTL
jgi:very-short-patch-repair endonuclease